MGQILATSFSLTGLDIGLQIYVLMNYARNVKVIVGCVLLKHLSPEKDCGQTYCCHCVDKVQCWYMSYLVHIFICCLIQINLLGELLTMS